MHQEDIYIFGASDHARVIIDIVELEGKYRIAGLFDSFKQPGTMVMGYEVLGNEDAFERLAKSGVTMRCIIGIGDNNTRRRIAYDLKRRVPGLTFVTAVHPSSTINRTAVLAPGSIVMARCYVGINTFVGEGAVIATNSIFEHDGIMGDYSTLGAGSTTGGHTKLGEAAAVCLGVTIIHGISVGANTVIGAGAIVIDDIPDHVVAYGAPARITRARPADASYLHIRSASYLAA
jgi:sugar O-acyltransferase (sialic acid O-acetyltransferase NeuD family)